MDDVSGSELAVKSGSGNDQVVVTGSKTDAMDFRLAGGDDVVSFGPGNEIAVGPFRIHGGGGIDEAIDFNSVVSPEPAELISIEIES